MANVYFRAIVVGVMAGMRSLVTPSIVSENISREHPSSLRETPLAFMGAGKTAGLLKALGTCELVCDKLPFMPNRTDTSSLIFRLVSGAVCGAALFQVEDENPAVGALIGGISAVASAEAFFNIRKTIVQEGVAPDALAAVAEDALVFALGRLAMER